MYDLCSLQMSVRQIASSANQGGCLFEDSLALTCTGGAQDRWWSAAESRTAQRKVLPPAYIKQAHSLPGPSPVTCSIIPARASVCGELAAGRGRGLGSMRLPLTPDARRSTRLHKQIDKQLPSTADSRRHDLPFSETGSWKLEVGSWI